MRPRAFIPSVPTRYDPISNSQVPTVDLRPVMAYGEPVLLVPSGTQAYPQRLIAEGLDDFTEDDYIVALGDPTLIAAAMYWAAGGVASLRMLRWNRHNSDYDIVEMML